MAPNSHWGIVRVSILIIVTIKNQSNTWYIYIYIWNCDYQKFKYPVIIYNYSSQVFLKCSQITALQSLGPFASSFTKPGGSLNFLNTQIWSVLWFWKFSNTWDQWVLQKSNTHLTLVCSSLSLTHTITLIAPTGLLLILVTYPWRSLLVSDGCTDNHDFMFQMLGDH